MAAPMIEKKSMLVGITLAMGITMFIVLRLLWRWVKRESALQD